MITALSLIILYITGCYSDEINDRPIIGILAQEPDNVLEIPNQIYTSYIAASYVKNIEASGGRVVPIIVIFPGGEALFDVPNGYADAGQYIFEIAKKLNDEGVYFPLFGVCLGFEYIVVLAAGRQEKNVLTNCSSHQNLPLCFAKDFRKSKLFGEAPQQIIDCLKNENYTVNGHRFCFVKKNFKKFKLTKDWIVSSYSYDENKLKFVATIESCEYPIYGTQFHPEKVAFEWVQTRYVRGANALLANRYFMDFFISESGKNSQRFSTEDEEHQHLIYNYAPLYTGKDKAFFEQSYMFEPIDNEKQEDKTKDATKDTTKDDIKDGTRDDNNDINEHTKEETTEDTKDDIKDDSDAESSSK